MEKKEKGKSEAFIISVWIEYRLIFMLGRKQNSKLPFSLKKVEKKLGVSKRHLEAQHQKLYTPEGMWSFQEIETFYYFEVAGQSWQLNSIMILSGAS